MHFGFTIQALYFHLFFSIEVVVFYSLVGNKFKCPVTQHIRFKVYMFRDIIAAYLEEE